MNESKEKLRYELLLMAQNIITENLMGERTRLENDWNMECDKLRKFENPNYPKFPAIPQIDVNSVIELAKVLNNFVSNNGE